MANILYNEARVELLSGGLDWANQTFAFAMVDDRYVPDEAHTWADVSPHVLGTSQQPPDRLVTGLGGAAVSTPAIIPNVTTPAGRTAAGIVVKRASDDLLVAAFTENIDGFYGTGYVPIAADNMTFYVQPSTLNKTLFRP